MTAAMRALAAPEGTEKVLRVAMLQGGRILEERVFRDRGAVLVGPTEEATFVAGSRSFTLFASDTTGYSLRLAKGSSGRVVTAEGAFDLASLGRSELRLDPSARGRVSLGDVTFLFQFVAPPPPRPRPQLPLSVRGNREVDWTITIVVAFSFLVHFGVIGSMYSDWLDPIVADDAVVGIIDVTHNLPAPTVEEVATAPTASSSAPSAAARPTKRPHASDTESRGDAERHAAALASEGRAMGMQLLVAWDDTSAVAGAMNRSELPVQSLDESARSAEGVRPADDLVLAHGGAVTPGHGSLRDLGVTHATGADSHGTERQVEGPRFNLTIEPLPPPNLQGGERAIARLRPSYRACYVNKGLSRDPSMAGKIVLSIRVAPNGDVAGVQKVAGSGLSSEVEQCIILRTHNAEFDAPGGSGATLQVPIIFEHQ